MAILIAFLIGIPAGIVSAVKKGTAWDYGAEPVCAVGNLDAELLAPILLIFLFSIKLGWLPASSDFSMSSSWAIFARK